MVNFNEFLMLPVFKIGFFPERLIMTTWFFQLVQTQFDGFQWDGQLGNNGYFVLPDKTEIDFQKST